MQPRIVHVDGLWIKNLPLHSDAVDASYLLEVGDLVRYESAGIGLFDTAAEDDKFMGVSQGKTLATMASGATGDYIPVMLKGVIECDLASANYNFGDALGYSAKNTFTAAVSSTAPSLAWFYGRDEDSITRGLVLIDVFALQQAFGLTT